MRARHSFTERLARRIDHFPCNITEAKPEELEELGHFRYNVYIKQSGKNAFYADHGNESLLEPLDQISVNLLAKDTNGQLVGTARISRASDGWSLPDQCQPQPWSWVPLSQSACVSRLMVARRGAPIVTMPMLFAACFRWGCENSIRFCVIFCAPHLTALFESYGCLQFAQVYTDPFAGPQVPMVFSTDREYLARISSPFLDLVGQVQINVDDIDYLRSLQFSNKTFKANLCDIKR